MVGIDIILKYFKDLSSAQVGQLEKLHGFYVDWNQKINVISRKDINRLYLHHVLHSLAIAKFIDFKPETRILDLGTGGGFPGIPLAIIFPEVHFLMIDGRAKKIKVVDEAIQHIGLKNSKALAHRSEDVKMTFDFVTARAVTRLERLIPWSLRLIDQNNINIIPNGLITLKGGDLQEEIKEVSQFHQVEQTPISDYFQEEYFDEKFILYIQA